MFLVGNAEEAQHQGLARGWFVGHFADCHAELHRNDQIEFGCSDVNQFIIQLQKLGVPLQQLRIRSRTLEDLFLQLTGRELRA